MTNLNEITYIDWQPKINVIGSIAEGADDINQCIEIILLTRKGSVPHRETTDAIAEWETRITIKSVSCEVDNSRIIVKIEWTLNDNGSSGYTEVIV